MRCPECEHEQKYRDGKHWQRSAAITLYFGEKKKTGSAILLSGGSSTVYRREVTMHLPIRSWRWQSLGPGGAKEAGYRSNLSSCWLRSRFGGIGLAERPVLGVVVFIAVLPCIIGLSRRKTVFHFLTAYHLVYRYHGTHPISGLADGRFLHTTETELQQFCMRLSGILW